MYEVVWNKSNPHKGEIRIRIEHKRLYNLYVRFTKELYGSSKFRNSDTFWNEMEKLGLVRHPKRRTINGLKKTCCDIYFENLKRNMKRVYPTYELLTWQHEEEFERFSKLLEDMRSGEGEFI